MSYFFHLLSCKFRWNWKVSQILLFLQLAQLVAVVYCCMFVAFVTDKMIMITTDNDNSTQSNCLLDSKRSMFIESVPMFILYVFCMVVFWAPILKIFLETIIVSRYRLNFLSSKSCSYWMNDSFVRIIFTSGVGIAAAESRTFLIQTVFSFVFQGYICSWNLFLQENLFFQDL